MCPKHNIDIINISLELTKFVWIRILITLLFIVTALPSLLHDIYSQELPSNLSDNSVFTNTTIPQQQVEPQSSSSWETLPIFLTISIDNHPKLDADPVTISGSVSDTAYNSENSYSVTVDWGDDTPPQTGVPIYSDGYWGPASHTYSSEIANTNNPKTIVAILIDDLENNQITEISTQVNIQSNTGVGGSPDVNLQPPNGFPVPDIEDGVRNIISGAVNGVQSAGDISFPSDQASDFLGGDIPVQPLLIIGVVAAVVVGAGAAIRSKRHRNAHYRLTGTRNDDRDYVSDVQVITRGGLE